MMNRKYQCRPSRNIFLKWLRIASLRARDNQTSMIVQVCKCNIFCKNSSVLNFHCSPFFAAWEFEIFADYSSILTRMFHEYLKILLTVLKTDSRILTTSNVPHWSFNC
jgi:hypothetical protein